MRSVGKRIRKRVTFALMDLGKVVVLFISLALYSTPVFPFETLVPLRRVVNGSRLSILQKVKTKNAMKMSVKFMNNKSNMSNCARWYSRLGSPLTERHRNHLPLRIGPLFCETRRGTVTSFAARSAYLPTYFGGRERSRPTGLTNRNVLYASAGRVNQSVEDRDGDDSENEEIDFSWESFDKKGGWQTIDWSKIIVGHHADVTDESYKVASIAQLCTKIPPNEPSPVELCLVRDRMAYVKRDDLLRLPNSGVSGNKARKMLALNELPIEDFPDAIVSYGGAQSNAMLALAAIAHAKNEEATSVRDGGSIGNEINDKQAEDEDNHENVCLAQEEAGSIIEEAASPNTTFFREQGKRKRKKRFVYYAKKLPRYLRKQPSGNLLRALSLGMEIVEISNDKYIELFGGDCGGTSTPPPSLEPPVPGKSVWIPQGGACGLAVKGVQLLAHEIVSFWAIQGRGSALSVCVPGGTCTTAMLLSREINAILKRREDKLDIQVVVIPCVGGDAYALRQMTSLDTSTGGSGRDDLPKILIPLKDLDYGPARRRNNGYFTFGEPAKAILDVFEEMKDEHGVYLDLLYGAPAWNLLLQHWKRPHTGEKETTPIDGRQIMYVHSGGLEGISSQMTRYKHKGLLDSSQIQSF